MKIDSLMKMFYLRVKKSNSFLNQVKHTTLADVFAPRDGHRKKILLNPKKAVLLRKEPASNLLSMTPRSEEESVIILKHQTFLEALRKTRYSIDIFWTWHIHNRNLNFKLVRAAERLVSELCHIIETINFIACSRNDYDYVVTKHFYFYNKLHKYCSAGDKKKSDFLSSKRIYMSTMESNKSTKMTNQEAGFGVNVQLAYDDDFEAIVKLHEFTFIMFYATWCGHCSTVKPVFSKLATHMKGKESPVGVVAIDAADNPKVADMAGIQNLPAFKLYVSGKFMADYIGDRSYEDMLKFIDTKRRNV